MSGRKVSIIGGDVRQEYMAKILKDQGLGVTIYALSDKLKLREGNGRIGMKEASDMKEAVWDAKTVVGPVPLTKDGTRINALSSHEDLTLRCLLECLHEGQTLYAGRITEEALKECRKKKIKTVDFMKIEEITVFNSIATAEGGICEAILWYPSHLHNAKCLILGFGRCAKTLADKLKGMSVRVSVCARSGKARAEAGAYGYETHSFEELKERLRDYDLIFNTVPDMVLGKGELRNVRDDAFIIDIASSPGGVDYEAAGRLKKNAKLCLGLPGKYSPKTSAEELVRWLEL